MFDQAENERLLAKARAAGLIIRSYPDWKQRGRAVRRGERQRRVSVPAGTRAEYDPVSGEYYAESVTRSAFGFTEDQLK